MLPPLVLLPATLAMGATLPMLARVAASGSRARGTTRRALDEREHSSDGHAQAPRDLTRRHELMGDSAGSRGTSTYGSRYAERSSVGFRVDGSHGALSGTCCELSQGHREGATCLSELAVPRHERHVELLGNDDELGIVGRDAELEGRVQHCLAVRLAF